MADKAVSNERRKELGQLDPFQENLLKAASLAKTYKNQLILSAGIVVVVAVVLSGIMYSFQRAEAQAAVLLKQALEAYAQIDDPEKGYRETEEMFDKLLTEYANTAAGQQARLQFAKICYDAAQYDLSYENYKKAFDLFKDDALMENFILASLGHVCLAKKDFEAAETYFLKIENSRHNLLKDEARYSLAMVYEASQETEKSQKMYEKIVSEAETSLYYPLAKSKITPARQP